MSEPNAKNLKILERILMRVVAQKLPFGIKTWQAIPHCSCKLSTAKELELCGMAACVGGYLAVSPEFKADGGYADDVGAPRYQGRGGYAAMALWLGISYIAVEEFACPLSRWYRGQPHGSVTAEQALRVYRTIMAANGVEPTHHAALFRQLVGVLAQRRNQLVLAEAIFRQLVVVLVQDNGGSFPFGQAEIDRAVPHIAVMHKAGYFQDDPNHPYHSFWEMGAGEEARAKRYFAECPEAYKGLRDVLCDVFEGSVP